MNFHVQVIKFKSCSLELLVEVIIDNAKGQYFKGKRCLNRTYRKNQKRSLECKFLSEHFARVSLQVFSFSSFLKVAFLIYFLLVNVDFTMTLVGYYLTVLI